MDAIIVGGGISGLCCARELHSRNKSFVILEASDRVGGRIATDDVGGFKLDRGFQVFLSSYPEAQRVLDYENLGLQSFAPGALVRFGGKFHRLTDPWRRPQHLLATAFSAAASFSDKLKVGSLRNVVRRGSIADLYERTELATKDALPRFGFSPTIINRFFQPFLSGIFLDANLETSTRMFEFVFRMFSEGEATLPTNGMQAIPAQVADALPADAIRLNSRVSKISEQTVTLEGGETLTAPAIIVATENPEAVNLSGVESRAPCGVTCVYFSASRAPIDEPTLILNGDGKGPINNLCFPNLVSPSYAPAGKTLVSVSVLDADPSDSIVDEVRSQLVEWFGREAADYEHLRTYKIPFALPSQTSLNPVEKRAEIRPGLYRCGDDSDTASINGAMASGRRAAEAAAGIL